MFGNMDGMAVTTSTAADDAKDFGEHLTSLRAQLERPDRSYERMARAMFLKSGGTVDVRDQTLANYHAGRTHPSRIDVAVLWHLANYYKVEPEALGEAAAARIRSLFGLTGRESPASGWFSVLPASAANLAGAAA